MKFTEEQIRKALNEAYKKSGHNAYFGEGFRAGVKFALSHVKKTEIVTVIESSLTIGFAEWLDIEAVRQNEHHWKCKADNYTKIYLTSEMLEMYYETLK